MLVCTPMYKVYTEYFVYVHTYIHTYIRMYICTYTHICGSNSAQWRSFKQPDPGGREGKGGGGGGVKF